jgi:D-alanyl-D-alanine carboxypeptidase/D-alanyl-D-alanine-endopeptidase (penicillin-binding protein 4)
VKRLHALAFSALALAAPALGSTPAPAGLATAPGAVLREAIERQVRASRRSVPTVGVEVLDLATGRAVYAHRADEPRIVASNTKLFTTAAALDALGPGYLFETRLLARGPVAAGVLAGDLAVIGGGDPSISGRHHEADPYAVFREWAATLKRRGIHRVTGDLLLDHGLFGGPVIHPDWPEHDRSRWFQAPVGALSFSDNCVLVRIGPSARVGAPARVELVPPLPLFQVVNRALTAATWKEHEAGVVRPGGDGRLTVFGSVYRRAGALETWVPVSSPVEYFGAALVHALAGEGIELGGRPRPVERLPGLVWEGVAVYRSDLLTAVQVTNKRSQNFYAECLLKLLGAVACGRGTWEGGTAAVADFLERVGLPRESYGLADGSGLSRGNRFTAAQVDRLLAAMYAHPFGVEFMRSLPYSGEPDLSWERRLAEPPYAGNVFAKTGTLQGVSTLSGYAKARSGRLYAFSILANDVRSTFEARRLQDRIVRAVIDHG